MSTSKTGIDGVDRPEDPTHRLRIPQQSPELRVIRSPQHGPAASPSAPGMLELEDPPIRQSLELIVAPPPLIIRSPQQGPASASSMPASMPGTQAPINNTGTQSHANHLEVVLHDPATQRVVIWDGSKRYAQVRPPPPLPSPHSPDLPTPAPLTRDFHR